MVLAQEQTPSQKYDNLKRISLEQYVLGNNEIGIEMDYGKYEVLNPSVVEKLRNSNVVEIRLVYTDHPKSRSFEVLNTNRLAILKKNLPKLFSDSSIQWFILKQTNCPSKEVAESYFHGFAIKIAGESNRKTPKLENTPNETIEKEPDPITPPSFTDDTLKKKNEVPFEIRAVLTQIPKRDWRYLSVGSDSISIKAFQRNHDKWANNIVTVSDWTASMYPYTTQVLRWHLNNQKDSKIQHFVFFNDGDKKRNNEKKKGKIGGIYTVQAESIPKIVNMMKMVKSRGDGGDLEENDIEALIWAMEKHPDADEFTLIADNKSEVRDMSLMGKLKKPVRIILGRLPEEDFALLNMQYIELALRTKGSIHTYERDFYTRKELLDLRKEVKDLRDELKQQLENKNKQ